MSGLIFFGDEGQESGIKSKENLPKDERIFDDVPNFLLNHGSVEVKKVHREVVRTWSFDYGGVLQG
jgi:hypothetical protein